MIKLLEKLVVAKYRRAEVKAAKQAEKLDLKARAMAEEARQLAEVAETATKNAMVFKAHSVLQSVKAEKLEEFFGKF